jgi:hypothetical protein
VSTTAVTSAPDTAGPPQYAVPDADLPVVARGLVTKRLISHGHEVTSIVLRDLPAEPLLRPQYALRGETVLPLATGGTPAHALVIDYALRPVLTSLGAGAIGQGLRERGVFRTEYEGTTLRSSLGLDA